MKLNDVLKERGSRYGDFDTFADISQQLKDVVYLNLSLDADEEKNNINNIISEGLDMIMHKIARILNGDPYYADNFIDIAGYASLVGSELEKLNKNNKEPNKWQDKCGDCKYLNHIVDVNSDIDFYVCEHEKNQKDSNIVHNGEKIKMYRNLKDIYKDCEYKETIFKGN